MELPEYECIAMMFPYCGSSLEVPYYFEALFVRVHMRT